MQQLLKKSRSGFSSLLFSSLLFVSFNELHAQGSQFLTEKPLLATTLNASEQTIWQVFSQKSTTQSMTLVEVSSLPSLISNGRLTFSIPGGAQSLQAEGNFITEEANGDFVWWANLIDQNGYIGVAKNSTGQFVAIQLDNEYYQIHPLSTRYNALVKLNSNIYAPDMCPPVMETPANITQDPTNCDDLLSNCSATVSVLVLVTPEALNTLGFAPGSMNAALYIPFGLHSINFALVNSGVFGKSFRFIVEGYNFNFTGSTNILMDLGSLQNDQAALARRTANRADLMVLLTNQRYINGLGVWTAIEPSFYGIVNIEHLFGVRNVFAHEVGHAFWLNHTRDEEGYYALDRCNFGYHFWDWDFLEHETIMGVVSNSEIQQGVTHILNYSNPDVDYNGVPTGTAWDANAFKLSQRMCVIQNNFDDEELEVAIIGPQTTCNELVDYSADIVNEPPSGQPGSGPFSYSWYKSSTGFFNSLSGSNNPPPEYLGNTPSIQLFAHETFWLKLNVCGTGTCVNHVIKVTDCDGAPQGMRVGVSTFEIQPELSPVFLISPNPVSDHLRLRLNEPIDGKLEYAIINSLGQTMISSSINALDQQSIEISLAGRYLPAGMYYCSIWNGEIVGAQAFSITK